MLKYHVVTFIVAAVAAVGAMLIAQPDPAFSRQICEEDMSCWDCATMGNRECGEDLIFNNGGITVVYPADDDYS